MYEIAIDAEQVVGTARGLADAGETLLGHKFTWMDADLLGLRSVLVFDEALHAASWAVVRSIDGHAAGLAAIASAVEETAIELSGIDADLVHELDELDEALEASR